MSKRASFQEELERLESIVRELEDSDVDLDQALVLFRDGVERLKKARRVLEDTEVTVQKVVKAAGEELHGDDVED